MRLRLVTLGGIILVAGAGVVLGWLFGLPELTALAVGGATTAALCALELHFGRPGPDLRVVVAPRAVPRGTGATLDLVLTNSGRLSSRPARVSGSFGTAGTGFVAVGPLQPGGSTRVAVDVPTRARGTVTFGPWVMRTNDPLRMWTRSRRFTTDTVLVVHPRVHAIAAVQGAGGRRLATGSRTAAIHGGADAEVDIVGLRPYVPGDDLRRIHWRTSARRNEPHVVQVEPPVGPAPTVVVLDTRADACDAVRFELTVEAAASVAAAAVRLGRPVRLVTTSSGAPRPGDHSRTLDLTELLDTLARVQQGRGGDLPAHLVGLLAPGNTVVLCTGDPSASADPRIAASTTAVVNWDGTTGLAGAIDPHREVVAASGTLP